MAEMNWTTEQSEAISIRNADTLVSAAAGSGKTAVLVERVIRMITDSVNPVDVDRLLVVTFTNAAARQMKQKIAASIVKEIEKNPRNERMRRQLVLLGNAGINTMHAFCLDLVRQNFQKTGLSCDFKIADPAETAMLKQDALEEAFGMLYEEQGEKTAELVEWYGGKDDKPLFELVLNSYEFLRSVPFYREWMKSAAKMPDGGIFDTVCGTFLKQYATSRLKLCLELAEKTVVRLNALDEGYGLSGYAETFSEDAALLRELAEAAETKEWDVLTELFHTVRFSTMKRMAKGGDAELAEEFKKTRQWIKDTVADLGKSVFFQPEEACFRDLKQASEKIAFLSEVILLFETCYERRKQKHSLVDFGDLEHLSIGILSERKANGTLIPSSVALQLRERYEEILIDEYQDTNDVQELIFSLTAGEQKRFMVGDIKQSIYGFRNSKPDLFLEKYRQYSKISGGKNRRLLLSRNFRSNAAVLSCCNFVFSKMMCRACGGLDYTGDEALYFGNGYPEYDAGAELYVLDRNDTDEEQTYHEREAELCAGRIEEMVRGGALLYDVETKEMRPCSYGDFTVLLRSVASRADAYTEAFSKRNIPYELEKGSSFFESFEVKLAVSMLRIIDNPHQDIPLLAVLRSPLFGFDDDLLTMLRLNCSQGDYYDCLLFAQENNPKVRAFLERLEHWRTLSDTLCVRKLLEQIYEESGILLYYSQKTDGELRRNRLRLLVRWAASFENTSYRGLFHFVTYLKRQMELAEEGVTMADTAVHGDAVTIMSIHKSKGLESNVIFLCDCGKKFNQTDSSKRLLTDESLGFCSDCVDTENHLIYETFAKKAAKLKKKQELQAEELRLLYVAMTRAKQKLVMIGSLRNADSHLARLRGFATGNGFETVASQNAGCYLDWLLSAFLFHPEGKILRSSGIPFEEAPGFSLQVYWKELPKQEQWDSVSEKTGSEPEVCEEDTGVLEYQYPFRRVCQIPAKLSVTELKRRYDTEKTEEGWVYYPREIAETPLPKQPAFLSEEGMTPAERGTAYHLAFQYLDFRSMQDQTSIEKQLDRLVAEGKMKWEDREQIDVSVLMRFCQTPLFDLVCCADRLEREKRFLLKFPAQKLFPDGGEEQLLIQGMIDCLIEKDGEWYLIDYKTDSDSDLECAKRRHSMQMNLYSLAAEQIYGKKPKQSYLYFVKSGQVVSCDDSLL